MMSWLLYLRRGLARSLQTDALTGTKHAGSSLAGLRNLRPFVIHHWRQGLVGTVLVLFITLLALPGPLINRYLIDQVILGRRLDLLVGVLALIAAVKVSTIVGGLLQNYYFAHFEQAILLDIQSELFARVLLFPKAFFDGSEVGYLMSRLSSDVQGLRWFFSSTIVVTFSNILRLIAGFVLLLYLNWQLALVALVAGPALALAVRFFSDRIRVLRHEQMEQEARANREMQESLSSVTLIKAFASEERAVGRLRARWQDLLQINLERITVNSLAALALSMVPALANGVVLVAGAYLVIVGRWTLGSLFAFQSYLGYVFGPAGSLATANLDLQSALASLQRVSALFDLVPEENLGQGLVVERLRGEVELRHVSFTYGDRDPVLEDVSLAACPGERLAIVGPSGVGKTTLISLLLRFYKPSAGEIYFDGLPAGAYELASLRRHIGYVSQASLLLSGTILDNLCYGNPEATEEQVAAAARVAGIHDLIMTLPDAYHSHVGERGVNLSEGQKQRLAIARALVKNPDILILDEPTSSLDSVVERSIFDALPAAVQGKTLFVVAHRLATVQNADRILLLNERRLLASGTHAELLRSNDYYQSLVANQQILAAA